MKNTAEEVVIPRELAHRLKNILMALETSWKHDEEKFEEVKRVSVDLIAAEKYLSRPGTPEELEDALRLIPGHNTRSS